MRSVATRSELGDLTRGRTRSSAALAEADPRPAVALAPPAEDHFVAIFEERARLAGRQRDRLRRRARPAPAGIRATRASDPTPCRWRADRPDADCSRCSRGASAAGPASSTGAAGSFARRRAARSSRLAHALASTSATSSRMSMPAALALPSRRRDTAAARDRRRAAGRPARETAPARRASRPTGEIDVAKLFARNGPSGWYSHAWMSRADQSFTRHTPKMCCSASSIGIGVAERDCPGPTKKPTSSS